MFVSSLYFWFICENTMALNGFPTNGHHFNEFSPKVNGFRRKNAIEKLRASLIPHFNCFRLEIVHILSNKVVIAFKQSHLPSNIMTHFGHSNWDHWNRYTHFNARQYIFPFIAKIRSNDWYRHHETNGYRNSQPVPKLMCSITLITFFSLSQKNTVNFKTQSC